MEPLAVQFVHALNEGDERRQQDLLNFVYREVTGYGVDRAESFEPEDPDDAAVLFAEVRRHLHLTDGSEVIYFSNGEVWYQGSGTGYGLWLSPEKGTLGTRFLADWFSEVGRLETPALTAAQRTNLQEYAIELHATHLPGQVVIRSHIPSGTLEKLWRGDAFVWSDGTGLLVDSDSCIRLIDDKSAFLARGRTLAMDVVVDGMDSGSVEATPAVATVAEERADKRVRCPGQSGPSDVAWLFSDASVLAFKQDNGRWDVMHSTDYAEPEAVW